MKSRKRYLITLVISLLLVGAFSMSAMATNYVSKMKKYRSDVYYNRVRVNYSDTVYHKFTMPVNGIAGLWCEDEYGYGMTVTLCNSRKQAISSRYLGGSSNGYKFYGLGKGTYYFKVSGERGQYLQVKIARRADNGGSTRARATRIYRNTRMQGLMGVRESYTTPDWYKFTLTSSRKVNIYYDMHGQGNFKIQLMKADGSFDRSISEYLNGTRSKGYLQAYRYSGSRRFGLTAGTYYIKITRTSKGSNMGYLLRWNYA